jgi:hypothetical protein
MKPQKTPQTPGSGPTQATLTGAALGTRSTAPTTPGRKTWIKKTPVEVVIEQLDKQEQRVEAMRKDLAHEEREFAKLSQARKVLEAQ